MPLGDVLSVAEMRRIERSRNAFSLGRRQFCLTGSIPKGYARSSLKHAAKTNENIIGLFGFVLGF